MSFMLEKDVDFAWITADFGSGSESYKITRYTISLMFQLLKKYGHRDRFDDIWQHKDTDAKVFVKPTENLDAYKQLEKKYAKNEYDLTDAGAIALRKEAICIVLLDWKEGVIQDKDGKNVQCGEKEKKQLVIDSPARIDWIMSQAIPAETFRPNEEQAAKNSERPSSLETEAAATKSNSQTVESVSK